MAVPYIQDESLKAIPHIRHGFFGREGGVSDGIYASLNVGAGSEDKPEHVAENKRRVAEEMGVLPSHLLTLYQVHSDRVLIVDASFTGERPQADGMVTALSGLVLGILTADCAPILFADEQAKVIGACHAGWKGAIANIPLRTIEAMEQLGARRAHIVAVIGPCIQQSSYEVDAGFYQKFLDQSQENKQFFIPSAKESQKYHFDLPSYAKNALLGCGLKEANVLAKDTCFLENSYFSYRRKTLRGEPDYGRQISAIALV